MAVCVLGSLNLDDVSRLPERARWGQTLIANSVSFTPGGKGLNQAVGAARMGSETRMIGAVGADAAGAGLLDYLRGAGVATADVAVIEGETSGRAIIMIAPDGENFIVVIPGANRAVSPDRVAGATLAGGRVFLAQLETPVAAIAAFFATPAAQAGRKILNTAPALADGARLFDHADMLIFNQQEFAAYLQLDREPEAVDELLVVRRLLTRPNQAAVVTLGARGSAAIWADRTMFVESFAADAVDTSGAGDCFCGAVAAAVDQGIGPERAMTLANAAASLAVRAAGAAAAMPVLVDVERLIVASGRG
ncbi:MAG: ribokinase [Janthinobacterium lividum]